MNKLGLLITTNYTNLLILSVDNDSYDQNY